MNSALERFLADGEGVRHRCEIRSVVPEHVLAHAVASSHVTRLLPQVYCLPVAGSDVKSRRRAALIYGGPGTALSHRTALAVWGLRSAAPNEPIELTIPGSRRLRNGVGLVVHRRAASPDYVPGTVVRDGLAVVRLDRAIVESWPQLRDDEQRAPAIVAVRSRKTTTARLLAEVQAQPKLAGRVELVRLVGLLGGGCHSELELWGYNHIFCHPSLPPSEAQVRVELGHRVVYLDRYFRRERVNVELDGAEWHQSAADRERDLKRDAQLMAQGILVVRFSHARLKDPDSVRAELLAILDRRRCDLGI